MEVATDAAAGRIQQLGRLPIDQLAPGGILAAPIGDENQELVLFERTASGLTRREVAAVRFVPMTGKAQERP